MTRPKKLNIMVSRMITALDVPLGRERMTNSIPMMTTKQMARIFAAEPILSEI